MIDILVVPWPVYVGVHGCARVVCNCMCGMNFQNAYWRLESLHQRTLIPILYEFFYINASSQEVWFRKWHKNSRNNIFLLIRQMYVHIHHISRWLDSSFEKKVSPTNSTSFFARYEGSRYTIGLKRTFSPITKHFIKNMSIFA